ncbi:hypothetical protein BXP70_21735 [Hymenobacter crusticola]|uniref:Secretion system C-terminal sorting domain-containing protein n=1 Tax=Hymenobacter crusticola TaxID=1770526 RepID=A0A243W890_9BACT|nr:hypothetical protein BXP70_21735 [Hymenobacter crusticola]
MFIAWTAILASVQAQAQCSTLLTDNDDSSDYTTTAPNQTICVEADSFSRTLTVNHDGCTINLGQNVTFTGQIILGSGATNCTINNNGLISNNFSGNGILDQASNVTGTVFNNLRTINSQTIRFRAPTTINNGNLSSKEASWTANFFNAADITAPLTITNYGAWNGQIATLPGGSITNVRGANWSVSIASVTTNPLTIINNGTWSGGYLDGVASNLTLTNTAIWSTRVYTGVATPTLTITNSGTWGDIGQIATTSTLSILNTGTWQNALFSNVGTTTIKNAGSWKNEQVNYSGPLTVDHSGSQWAAILTTNNASASSLTVTNAATWGKGIDFPAGPNAFTNNVGATATFPSSENLSFNGPTLLTNHGILTINEFVSLPGGSTLATTSSGTTSINGDVVSSGALQNQGLLTITGNLTTSGLLTNANRVRIVGDFTNSGIVNGPAAPSRGSIRATGYTTNSGTFGVTGQLDFCDAGMPTAGFDSRGGAIGDATSFCSATPLPVVLSAFTATRQAGQVRLYWSTAQELNSAYFVIERAADGYSFVAVAQVNGHGTTQRATNYSALDATPLATTSYYRLRQVDADGTSTYSPVATVTAATPPQAKLALMPNPAQRTVWIQGAQAGNVQLLDGAGRILRTQAAQEQALDLTGIQPGLYIVRAGTQTARLQVE